MNEQKDFITFRLFSPLTANLYTSDESGGFSDWPEELSPEELCVHEDKIIETIQREHLKREDDHNLAVYLRDAAIKEKVYSMNPTVETWQGELWGVLEVRSYEQLTEAELEVLIDEWCGQESDGWGEGFEQRPIKTEDGELYVSFWHSGNDFFIKSEQELKGQDTQNFNIQMGGM